MKKISFIIIVILFSLNGNAQLLKNIAKGAVNQAKQSAANKASEQVNKEVDKGVNKFFDNLLKEDSTKKESATPAPVAEPNGDQPPVGVSNFMKRLGVSTEAIPHKEKYMFTGQMVTSLSVTDENGEKVSASDYISNFNEGNSDAMFEMKAQDAVKSTVTIIDQENKCMMMLSEEKGQKTGFATRFDPNTTAPVVNGTVNSATPTSEECTPVKTGKTQKISGFNCVEYRCENNESITTIWTTKDFAAKNTNIFGQNAMGVKFNTTGIDGMMIQYETHSKSDKSSTIMTVKSMDMKKSSSFSTDGYQISSLNINAK